MVPSSIIHEFNLLTIIYRLLIICARSLNPDEVSSCSKLFIMVISDRTFRKKSTLKKNSTDGKKHAKLPSMQIVMNEILMLNLAIFSSHLIIQ